ncbi:putative nuclease HARBI1 [Saccostrea cucullata]|uniref:putative nuclease HARBI1 n=1 Tax=Saccostrea cuccullata TaxID=36930 RepID=UPI002ED1BC0B
MAAFLRFYDDETRKSLRRQRIFRDRLNPLNSYCDEEMIKRFRLDRGSILSILDNVGEQLERPTKRSQGLPASIQLFAALRFLASGTEQRVIGDTLGISKSSVCKSIDKVVKVLSTSLNTIKFPSEDADILKTKHGFYSIAGFPNVVGAIDGTLIPITAPKSDEHLYICRKGFHSINVQAIVDSDLKFLSVVSKWPGATHDAFIWANSGIARKFERSEIDGWLLGDSGYPLRPWLLTPVNNPKSRGEQSYNGSHRKTRVVVEQAFGVLKSRFRCLHKTGGALNYEPEKCCMIAYVCCQLHNICVDLKLPILEEDEMDDINDADQDGDLTYQGPLNDGKTVREALIRQRFL